MFELNSIEFDKLKSWLNEQGENQSKWGGRRKFPLAFTEQGIAMLSSVLKSKRAIQVNIAIMDTFVRLREMAITHQDLARKINHLEKKYDHQFKAVFEAIRQLMDPPQTDKKPIGFERN